MHTSNTKPQGLCSYFILCPTIIMLFNLSFSIVRCDMTYDKTVVNGLQAHAPWFYDASLIENWSGFPKAQHRLYQTILQPNV